MPLSHLSLNGKISNCFEVTFFRKDRARVSEKAVGPYAHPLDVLNSDSKSQIVASFPVGTVAETLPR